MTKAMTAEDARRAIETRMQCRPAGLRRVLQGELRIDHAEPGNRHHQPRQRRARDVAAAVPFRAGIAPREWARVQLWELIRGGHCHIGLRYLPHSLAGQDLLRTRNSVLPLRDMCDAATSHSFSTVHEHPVPGGGKDEFARRFREDRARLRRHRHQRACPRNSRPP